MRHITMVLAILALAAAPGCGLQRGAEPAETPAAPTETLARPTKTPAGPTETPAGPKGPSTQQAEIVLVNRSSQTICYVYIVMFMADGGDDWLGPNEVLPAGASRTFELAAGWYDLYARDCARTDWLFYQGNAIDSRSGVEVVGTYVWEVTD